MQNSVLFCSLWDNSHLFSSFLRGKWAFLALNGQFTDLYFELQNCDLLRKYIIYWKLLLQIKILSIRTLTMWSVMLSSSCSVVTFSSQVHRKHVENRGWRELTGDSIEHNSTLDLFLSLLWNESFATHLKALYLSLGWHLTRKTEKADLGEQLCATGKYSRQLSCTGNSFKIKLIFETYLQEIEAGNWCQTNIK